LLGETIFSEAPIVSSLDYTNTEREVCVGSLHPLRQPEIRIPKELEEVLQACDVDYKAVIQENIEKNQNYLTNKVKKCDNCHLKFSDAEVCSSISVFPF
jgi:hypothetical protein